MFSLTPKNYSHKREIFFHFLNKKLFKRQIPSKSSDYNEMVDKFYSKIKK